MRVRPSSIWMLHSLRTSAKLECFQLCSFDQCIFELCAKKPTTLMLLRLSTFRDLALTRGCGGRCSHPSGHRPLQGIQQDGSFSTARAKIYPEAMNRALAIAVSRFLTERHLYGVPKLPMDLQELNSTDITDGSIVQPDYHQWLYASSKRDVTQHQQSERYPMVYNGKPQTKMDDLRVPLLGYPYMDSRLPLMVLWWKAWRYRRWWNSGYNGPAATHHDFLMRILLNLACEAGIRWLFVCKHRQRVEILWHICTSVYGWHGSCSRLGLCSRMPKV